MNKEVLFDVGGMAVSLFNIPVFVLLVLGKSVLTFYAIMQWLCEYYEITPEFIYHRRGAIFKTEEKYT
jgi:hypothetical protein